MTALLIFIDNPEHASLEPALAAAVPAETTPRIHEALLEKLRNLTALFAGEKYLYYSHYPNWNDAWDINLYRKRIQIGDTTAERIGNAINDALEDQPEAILWITISAALLEPGVFETVTGLLNDHDLVIGEDPSGTAGFLGFGHKAYQISGNGIPEPLNGDEIAITANAAGIRSARIEIPALPKSPEDLVRLGIAVD